MHVYYTKNQIQRWHPTISMPALSQSFFLSLLDTPFLSVKTWQFHYTLSYQMLLFSLKLFSVSHALTHCSFSLFVFLRAVSVPQLSLTSWENDGKMNLLNTACFGLSVACQPRPGLTEAHGCQNPSVYSGSLPPSLSVLFWLKMQHCQSNYKITCNTIPVIIKSRP